MSKGSYKVENKKKISKIYLGFQFTLVDVKLPWFKHPTDVKTLGTRVLIFLL